MALGKNLTKRQNPEQPENQSSPTEKDEAKSDLEPPKDEVEASTEESATEDIIKSYQQFCVFKSGREEYAISIDLVREVVPYPASAYVPQMPDYLKGMANVRGNIYGILDLAEFFKVDNESPPKYLMVLDIEDYQMGIAIPEVPNTLMISEDMIESLSTSRLKSTIGQKYLKGIIKKDRRMIILFDILGMISSDKFTLRS